MQGLLSTFMNTYFVLGRFILFLLFPLTVVTIAKIKLNFYCVIYRYEQTKFHCICREHEIKNTACRGVATGAEGGRETKPRLLPSPTPPQLKFPNQKGATFPVSEIRDIAFYGCSEIIRTRNFRNFTVYATNFWTIYSGFSFCLTS